MQGINGIFAQLQQGQQAATAAAAAAAQPQAQQPTVFALTPGQTHQGQLIDYTTSTGIKLWSEATASLPNKFTGEGKDLNAFSEAVLERANKSGWMATGGDIIRINVAGEDINLLTQYGRLTADQIRIFGTTYINQQNRQRQNDAQMYHCLRNSLTDEAANNILSERDNYHINQEPSGPLLFKLLVQKAVVDVRATATLMRTNLTELVKYMELVNCDISKFNQYVKLNHEGLHARGESCPDLMIHLFNAYLSVKDKQFKTYMNLKKIAYDDGTNFTPEQLMSLALGQYTIISNSGKWNARSPEEEQVVALSARFEKLKDANLKLSKAIKDKAKTKQKGAKSTSKGTTGQSKKGKKNEDEKYAWKQIKPQSGQPHKKTVDGKQYHWCPWHNAWTVHDPNDERPDHRCRLKPVANSATSEGTNQSQVNADDNHRALAAVIGADIHYE